MEGLERGTGDSHMTHGRVQLAREKKRFGHFAQREFTPSEIRVSFRGREEKREKREKKEKKEKKKAAIVLQASFLLTA